MNLDIARITRRLNDLAAERRDYFAQVKTLSEQVSIREKEVNDLEKEFDKFDQLSREENIVWDILTDALCEALDEAERALYDLENDLEDAEDSMYRIDSTFETIEEEIDNCF